MQFIRRVMSSRVSASRLHRAMSWCLLVGLCIQLLALTQHHHELTAQPHDCEACYLTALTSGGSSPPHESTLLALPFFQASCIAVQREDVILFSFRDFIRPLSQAPPTV
jgi:hypothetical protein